MGRDGERSTIQRITLEPGTRAIVMASINQWAHHGEYEVVLNKGSKYELMARSVKRWVLENDRFHQDRVTDIRMVP